MLMDFHVRGITLRNQITKVGIMIGIISAQSAISTKATHTVRNMADINIAKIGYHMNNGKEEISSEITTYA